MKYIYNFTIFVSALFHSVVKISNVILIIIHFINTFLCENKFYS